MLRIARGEIHQFVSTILRRSMSNTVVLKSGKTVTTDENGVTTITKVVNGKTITKKYNMNNLHAGGVVGGGRHVNIGNNLVRIESDAAPPGQNIGPAVPVGGIAGRANSRSAINPSSASSRTVTYQQPTTVHVHQPNPRVNPPRAPVVHNPPSGVKNQFNITGSVIGQVAIGNKGTTVFNNKTEQYNAGAQSNEYKIKGGNFAQANIGGQATYNNKDAVIDSGAGSGGGLSIDDLLYSDGVAEKQVLEILKKGMTVQDFMSVLRSGMSISTMHKGVSNVSRVSSAIVEGMLGYDGSRMEVDSSDSSDSDSDSDSD